MVICIVYNMVGMSIMLNGSTYTADMISENLASNHEVSVNRIINTLSTSLTSKEAARA